MVCACVAGAAAALLFSAYSDWSPVDFRGFPRAVETIEGQTTRWTQAYSKIEFPGLRWRPLRIELFVRGPADMTSSELLAQVTADDMPLGEVRVTRQEWKRYEFVVRRGSSLLGPLALRFSSETAGDPARGVGVGRIRVRPAGIALPEAALLTAGGTLSLAVWLFFPPARPIRRWLFTTIGPFFETKRPALTRLVLAGVMLMGIAIRIPELGDPPSQFHPTRQYRSALIARAYVIDRLPSFSPAEVAAVKRAGAAQGLIEPPVFEHVAAGLYRVAGREALWMPRLFGVLAWMLGALAIWWLVRLAGQNGRHSGEADAAGLVAVAVYVLLPFGVPASQAFQPDAIMTALIAASLAALTWHDRRQSRTTLVMTVATATLALFIKPMAMFFILPPAFVFAVGRRGFLQGTLRCAVWAALVGAPAIAWSIYVSVVAPSALQDRFFPQLLARPDFWTNWGQMADRVATWPILLLSLTGVVLAARARRWALVAAWSGYVVFGLLFAYHIHTHDYYSLPLVPLAAWSIGALVQFGGSRSPAGLTRVAVRAVAVVLALGAVAVAWRHPWYSSNREIAQASAARYEEIARLVNHSAHVVTLDSAYGFGLDYHGRLRVATLPLGADRAVSSLAGRSAAVDARAALTGREFFVATSQRELDAWPALRDLLAEQYRLVARDGSEDRWEYVVYDLQRGKDH
jgi:hypothetical protein